MGRIAGTDEEETERREIGWEEEERERGLGMFGFVDGGCIT